MGKTLHSILEKLDGYLISIDRDVDTSMYKLQVGFRKNWVFKSTDDVECNIEITGETGAIVTISAKHDETTIDDLIDFVNKVVDTNQKITEKQQLFEKELEEEKEKLANKIIAFEEEMEEFRDNSFEEEEVEKPKSSKKSTNKNSKKKAEEVFTDDEDIIQKVS